MTSIINLTIGGKTKRSTTGQHPVSIDWNALPDASQAFVIQYGLKQYLADGMAGAESEADAKAGVERRVEKLVTGDLTRSRDTDKPDSVEVRALKNARTAVRAKAKELNKTLTKEQVSAAAKAWVEKNPKFLAEAKKQIEAEKKSAELVADDTFDDILADLIGGNEAEADDEADDNDGE